MLSSGLFDCERKSDISIRVAELWGPTRTNRSRTASKALDVDDVDVEGKNPWLEVVTVM